MHTLELSNLELSALRVALTKRALNLRLDVMSFERCGLSADSINKELEVVTTILSKLS